MSYLYIYIVWHVFTYPKPVSTYMKLGCHTYHNSSVVLIIMSKEKGVMMFRLGVVFYII